ncbi:MAG: shikimate kinase [Candidatus Bathyarchaeota archaeon]
MNIVLIGMSGSGKSLIGRKIAMKLNYEFIDVDDIIQRKTQMDLQGYINKFGDEEFLKFEEKTILDLDVQNCVIAPGGRIIYSQKAINPLKRNSIIIFLDLSLEV